MRAWFWFKREEGFSLLEVMASMAILVMAATILTTGLLFAYRLTLDARMMEESSRRLAADARQEKEPEKTEEISLSFTIDGRRVELGALALCYEEEGKSFWRIAPLDQRQDGDQDEENEEMEEMYGR